VKGDLHFAGDVVYDIGMAVKKKTQRRKDSKIQRSKKVEESMVMDDVMIQESNNPIKVEKKDEEWGEPLDPQEEKVLDWILKGVVIFILGWLGLSILLVIGGYFGLWK
jgi:hypothetical protein